MRAPCVILCLIGLYLSVLLLQLHTGDPAVPGFATKICDAVGGCHQVLQSKWSNFPPVEKVPADSIEAESRSVIQEYAVPVALLGLFYYCGFLVWFLFIGRSTTVANTVVLVICLLSCLVSIWYFYVMTKVIGAACPFCLITHAVNFLLFGATLMYFFKSEEEPYQPRELYGATAVAILALWSVIGLGWRTAALREDNEVLTRTLSSIRGDIAAVEMAWRANDPVEIAIRDNIAKQAKAEFDPIVQALPGFRNTVVVFGDAESPACGKFRKFLFEQVSPFYGGHLRIVWKHLPSGESHSKSWTAARALEAARLQGKFWELLKALQERENGLDDIDYPALAADCGINPDRFNRDVRSGEVRDRIEADIREAKRLGLDGTAMAVFLNSRQVGASIQNLPGFWKLQASRLRDLRISKEQGWGTAGTGLAGSLPVGAGPGN